MQTMGLHRVYMVLAQTQGVALWNTREPTPIPIPGQNPGFLRKGVLIPRCITLDLNNDPLTLAFSLYCLLCSTTVVWILEQVSSHQTHAVAPLPRSSPYTSSPQYAVAKYHSALAGYSQAMAIPTASPGRRIRGRLCPDHNSPRETSGHALQAAGWAGSRC